MTRIDWPAASAIACRRPRRGVVRFAAAAAWLLTLGVLVGCAGPGVSDGLPAAAPTLHVGDRWIYHGEDGFRQKVIWEETHEITAIDADGVHVRVTLKNPTLDIERTELWVAPGSVKVGALMDIETRRFTVPLERYRFPLERGETWNQRVDNYNETARREGQISRFARVDGWEKIATPAGTFDALRIRIIMRLDDDEFWRTATECNYLVWYVPDIGATVREDKQAQYLLRDGMNSVMVRAQYTFLELDSFTRGK